MYIAVDFDGTVAKWDSYPDIGDPVPYALETLSRLKQNGHDIILWTCRDNTTLPNVIEWFQNHWVGSLPSSINVRDGQTKYSMSPKVDADLYIDDKALGCPLVFDSKTGRPMADWKTIQYHLMLRGLL